MFSIIIIGLSIALILSQKKEFSEMENRYLKEFPQFSAKKIFDKSLANDIDTYVSDHFVGRDLWVGMKSSIEYMSGKRENNDIIIGKNQLFSRISEPDEAKVDKNIQGIISFAKNNNVQPYVMIVPSASEIQEEKLPMFAESTLWEQNKVISDINERLGEYVVPIDIYEAFHERKDDYLYYLTDHHWTTYGAYVAYVEAGKYLQYEGLDMGLFSVETASNKFYGTLYSEANYRAIQPDIMEIYQYSDSNSAVKEVEVFDGKETKSYNSMYFKEYLDKKDKYAMFLGANQPIVNIKTNNTGRKILIFKDSYAHAFAPFLVEADYSEITLVDLRYLTNTSYKEYIDFESYDQILLLYSIDSFVNYADTANIDW